MKIFFFIFINSFLLISSGCLLFEDNYNEIPNETEKIALDKNSQCANDDIMSSEKEECSVRNNYPF